MARQIIVLLQLLAAFQCALFSFYLLLPTRTRRLGNYALAAMLMMLALHMLVLAGQRSGQLSSAMKITYLFGFLYGPCFLLYIHALTRSDAHLGRRMALHLFPFAVGLVLWLFDALSWQLQMAAVTISLTAYLVASLFSLNRYQQIVENTHSDLHRLALRWLRIAIAIWALVVGLFATLFVALLVRQKADSRYFSITIGLYLATLVFVSAFVLAALIYPDLFRGISAGDEETGGLPRPDRGEPNAEDIRLAALVNKRMIQDRPYLQPRLSLAELARQLEIPPRRLSQTIHACFGQNFCDFVNSYRIEAAKERLLAANDPDMNVLDIMYSVGFNSKSVFNAIFKSKTGLSPTEFRTRCRDPGSEPELT